MARPGLVVLAILAALLGAPQPASAAGNVLHSQTLSPSSGTTATTFVLRVAYEGGFPAMRVDAVAAGRTLAMARVDGTPEAGTWEASTTLPAGSWQVVFVATVGRGNSPVLAAGTVTVAALDSAPVASPSPSRPGPMQAARVPAPETVTLPSSAPGQPAPAPETEPVAAPPPAATRQSPAPQPEAPARPGGATPAASSPATSATDGAESPDSGPPAPAKPAAPEPSPDEGTARSASPGASSSIAAGSASPRTPGTSAEPSGHRAPVESGAGRPDDGTRAGSVADDAAGMLGAWAVGLAAACGFVLLVLARRRRTAAPEPEAASLADETAALLQRRALRRARTMLPDDPIISSLGLDDAAVTRRRAERRSGGERSDST